MTEKLLRDFMILWATIDPVGTLALFAGLTRAASSAERRRIALKAVLYAGVILVGSIIAGQVILTSMGVQLRSLQLAGGAILFLFGLQMIFGRVATDEKGRSEPDHDLAVFPLAVPSIASPGAIMAVILLTDNHTHSIPVQATTAAMLVIVLVATWFLMLCAEPILKVIGQNGAAILIRVMGMILAAFSVELALSALGIAGWPQAGP